MRFGRQTENSRRWITLALLCLVAGCATSKRSAQAPIFFPPPPDQPRIQFLTSFGAESDLGSGNKFKNFVLGDTGIHRPIWKPYGITVTKGAVYVCDTEAANVGRVDLAKRSLRYLKPGGQAVIKLPIGVAVDNEGTQFVTDIKRGQVLVYRKDGSFVGEIGKPSEMKPSGIALSQDRLYVADMTNHCVRVYDKSKRELLFKIPAAPDEKSRLLSPTNLTLDEKGQLYVTDTGDFSIKIYDAQGKYLRTIGEMGLTPGRFALPKGVGVDREGRVYVVDAQTALAQVFDPEGRSLMYFGDQKSSGPAGLCLPAGLAIDYSNVDHFKKYAAPGYKIEFLIFVTNQAGPQKVSVYGFMQKT